MSKTETVIHSILGPTCRNIRPLVCAVDVAVQLLFVQNVPMSDIKVTKDVYPVVAKRLNGRLSTVSRQIERLARFCWDVGDQEFLAQMIGRRLQELHEPKDMLFYIAFFTHLDTPFFAAIQAHPEFLMGKCETSHHKVFDATGVQLPMGLPLYGEAPVNQGEMGSFG